MIITFCGHSQYSETDADRQKVLALLEELAGDAPCELFLGGYGGFDAFAKKCGKQYQKKHPNTKLIFVTPYLPIDDQKKHLSTLSNQYDEILYPSLEHVPPKFAILHRNKWMATQADCMIAYIDHTWGGAYNTYRIAKRLGKQILNIAGKEI